MPVGITVVFEYVIVESEEAATVPEKGEFAPTSVNVAPVLHAGKELVVNPFILMAVEPLVLTTYTG